MNDNKNTIKCPACGCEMKKVYVPAEEVYVDICTEGCGGIYFDNRELDKFDEANENIDVILNAVKDKEFKKVDENQKRICPVCNTPMVKHFMSIKQEIEIDDCYGCGGKFLDNGELQKLRAQYKNNTQRKQDVLDFMRENLSDEYKDLLSDSSGVKYQHNSIIIKILKDFIE